MLIQTNIFENVPTDLSKEVFEKILSTSDFTLERIISHGHTSPEKGWYIQKKSEWIIVLEGEAVVSFEDKDIRLCKGDHINITAGTKHKVSWTKPDSLTFWLALHY